MRRMDLAQAGRSNEDVPSARRRIEWLRERAHIALLANRRTIGQKRIERSEGCGDIVDRVQVLEGVQEIIRVELDDRTIHVADATVIDDIPDWDSVAHVRIVVAIEMHFGIMFQAEEYTEFADVGEMIDCICAKIARRGAHAVVDASASR